MDEATRAVQAIIGDEDPAVAMMLAQAALTAATPGVLAAVLADIADDLDLMGDSGQEWAYQAGYFLDHMSAHIRELTEGQQR